MSNPYKGWGIVSLFMTIGFTIIGIINDIVHKKKDLFSWIILIFFFSFCSIKMLLLDTFKLVIYINKNEIIAKNIFIKPKTILWKNIRNVTLDKKSASILVNDDNKTINISLRLQKWELLLEAIEDNVSNDKFVNFN
jgi:hypothetical protein